MELTSALSASLRRYRYMYVCIYVYSYSQVRMMGNIEDFNSLGILLLRKRDLFDTGLNRIEKV